MTPQVQQELIKRRIAASYGIVQTEIQKSEPIRLEKGGKRAAIGETRKMGGREYIKTSDGWKYHGKGTGKKAQQHKASSSQSNSKKAAPTEKPKIKATTKEVSFDSIKKDLKFPSSTKMKSGGLYWTKKGGHAGSKTISTIKQAAIAAGWKESKSESSDHPGGNWSASKNGLIDPTGQFELTTNQHYGAAAYENSYTATVKKLTPTAKEKPQASPTINQASKKDTELKEVQKDKQVSGTAPSPAKVQKDILDLTGLPSKNNYGWEPEVQFNEKNGNCYISFPTMTRGPRTDHGGGKDGDDWMNDNQISALRKTYGKQYEKHLPKIQDLFAKWGYEGKCNIDYDEKGHVSIVGFFEKKK